MFEGLTDEQKLAQYQRIEAKGTAVDEAYAQIQKLMIAEERSEYPFKQTIDLYNVILRALSHYGLKLDDQVTELYGEL